MSKINLNKLLNMYLYVIILDLVLGGSGNYFTIGPLSIRYILFAGSLTIFLILFLASEKSLKSFIYYKVIAIFIIFSIFSVLIGLVYRNPTSNVISSFRGYLFILMYFPFVLFITNTDRLKKITLFFVRMSVLLAIISILIFIYLLIFPGSFNTINGILLGYDFGFLSIRYGLTSVFFKTSPFVAISAVFYFHLFINEKNSRNIFTLVAFAILSTSVMITMTMGIWFCFFAGLLVSALYTNKKSIIYAIPVGALVIVIMLAIPYTRETIISRLNFTDTSFIIKADQLKTLTNIFFEHPFLGSGFGKTVTFITEFGVRIMYRFELFYLEILVNMGIIGAMSFFAIFVKFLVISDKQALTHTSYDRHLIRFYFIGVIMLLVVTSVNPFINNPIGLGFTSIALAASNIYDKEI